MLNDDSPPLFFGAGDAGLQHCVEDLIGVEALELLFPEPLPCIVAPVELLDPDRLSAEAEARLQSILVDELAANTRRTYRYALKLWCAWYTGRYGHGLELPVPVAVVQQFMVDFAAHESQGPEGRKWGSALPPELDERLVGSGLKAALGPWALNTVETRVAALAAAHRARGLATPTETTQILRLRRALRRHQAARGIRERHARAIRAEGVRRMMAACEGDLRGARDRALIGVGFGSGGRRRSEIAAMTVEALERHPDGSFTYHLGKSKTNQLGKVRAKDRKPIQGAAADYLTLWLEASGIESGAVWRRIEGNRVTTPLSETSIYDVVVKRAGQAGIGGAVMAHSLRAGYVTEALDRDLPLSRIMDRTGHETVQSVREYDRPEERAEADATACLLG